MYAGSVIDAHTHPLLYPEGQIGEPHRPAGGSPPAGYPIGDPVADLEAAKSLGFSDAELAAVLHDNAAALLG